ncbi:beta-carotene 15,15'-monooxygenase [Virgibacillus sp. W0181]|uniref:beta-carotene 15,15'-monooxygenase n=1 Tax=Virgibacillus sp. W0181 TaxID=3391581 RepID=UPI003F467F46
MSIAYNRKLFIILPLLTLVLAINYMIYHVSLPFEIPTEEMTFIAIGSLFDLLIVVPILLLVMTSKKRQVKWKQYIACFATGAVVARLIIPLAYFDSFHFVTYPAIVMEGIILLMEIGVVFLLFWRLPKIISTVKSTNLSPLFSLSKVVSEQVNKHFITQVIAQECLIFYYTFLSWKKNPPTGRNILTLHKNTSMIAFYIMLIHAIIIETIGLHWWLHQKSVILSIILLILNVYTILFFIADIQAIRLNPLRLINGNIYLSLGLTKRITIPLESIKAVQWEEFPEKVDSKTTIEFIAKDMETLPPHCIITFHQPIKADLLFGFTKKYEKLAIRVDDPGKLKQLLHTKS